MNEIPALFDASTAQPMVSQGGAGAISGGLLRPGAIDQGQFQQMLQAQQSAREAAGVGGTPVMMPIQPFQDGIPTLTSAQFAALVGNQAAAPADESDDSAAAPQTAGASTAPAPRTAAMSASATLKLSGAPLKRALDPNAAQPASAGSSDQDAAAADDGPTIFRAADPKITAVAAATPAAQPAVAAAATAAADGTTSNAASPTEAPSDPRVVHLKDAPDRETRQALISQGKRWIVDETPGSRQLFFGDKGTFGWKDFLDIINPLQHIPIVAQIYRAITGDQINGAAELIGAIPFGPLGAIGMLGSIADLAVKDVTGKDIGDNLEAMVFGPGTKGTAAGADTAAVGGSIPGNAASDDAASDQAATTVTPRLQTAYAKAAANLEMARQMHDQARA